MTMTFQLAVGLCSVIGAALFFAAGFMAARMRFSASASSPGAAAAATEATAEKTRKKSTSGSRTPASPPAGAGSLAGLFMEALQAGERQAADSQREAQLQALNAKLKQAFQYVQQLKRDTAVLARQKSALEKEKKDCENRLKDLAAAAAERKNLAAKLAERQSRLDAAAAENENLAAQIRELRSQGEASGRNSQTMETVQAENRDLSLQVRHLSEQLKELEQLRQENQELKSYKGVVKEKDAEIEALRSENAKLNSMKIVWDAPPQPVANLPKEGLGQAFQRLVNRLSESEAARGVALADELGLMIAGTSDHAEALAGMAAVFTETQTTLGTMLPFGTVDHLKIVNQKALTLMMRPLTISGHDLILSTLTTGEGPGRESIEGLLQEIAG